MLCLIPLGLPSSWAQTGSVSYRNGSGVNPSCLQSQNVPAIGAPWLISVDVSGVPGATLAVLQSRALPGMGSFLPAGELLLNLASTSFLALSSVPQAGLSSFQIMVPNNLALVGFPLSIQAGVRRSEVLLALCNAEDIVIGALPSGMPDFSADITAGAAPLRVSFNDQSSGLPSAWSWDFGDGGSSTLQNPKYVYRTAGSYDVSLSLSSSSGTVTELKPGFITLTGSAPRNNVLVVMADDLGASDLALYGLNPNLPPGLTPNIDSLAAKGLLFERAWSNPLCSPARAMLLTGRYGFRTGLGNTIDSSNFSLRAAEVTLPEALEIYSDAGYAHAAFGKWHLRAAVNPDLCAVTQAHGFDSFEGTAGPVLQYCAWNSLSCPSPVFTPSSVYQLDQLFDASVDWIAAQPGNWFCYVAPQAPYDIAHIPPSHLQSLVAGADCAACPPGMERSCFLAALQALDTKLGQLIASLGPAWEQETTIIFLGDNGTPQNAYDTGDPSHGKGTLFEGGLHVPMIIAGRALDTSLRGTRSAALVSVVDLYRTIFNLTGGTGLPASLGQDSVDLTPLLQSPFASAPRSTLFAERFRNNAPLPPYLDHIAAMRNDQYKIIYNCSTGKASALYDLLADPLELNDLLLGTPPLPGTPEGDALLSLEAELKALIQC